MGKSPTADIFKKYELYINKGENNNNNQYFSN